MVTCNFICKRSSNNNTAMEKSGFQPVPGGSEWCEPASGGAKSLIPIYKRFWVDPLWFRYITTAVWAFSVGVTFGIVGDFSMFFIFLERDFNSSVTELSWLGALPWCLCCIFSPLSNVIVKRLGYRVTMSGACAIAAIGLFSTSFIHALWPAYLTYSIMVGGSTVVLYTAGCVYVTGYFDKKHCTGPVSANGLAFDSAILVFSPVIQVTSEGWGWRWSVRLLSSFTLAAASLLAVVVRSPPKDMFPSDDIDIDFDKKGNKRYRKVGEKDTEENDGRRVIEEKGEEGDFDGEDGEKERKKTSWRRYVTLARMPEFWLLVIGIVISFTALSFNNINFGSYLTSVGVSTQKTALFHSFLAGGSLVGRISVLFVHLLPCSILLTYPTIALTSCLVSIAVLLVTPQWIFYIYSVLIGLMRGLYFSLGTGIAVELCGRDNAAEAYASTFVAWGIGSALAAVVPGVTHHLSGSYRVSLIVCAAFWGLSSVLFFAIYVCARMRKRRQKRDDKKKIEPETKEVEALKESLSGDIHNDSSCAKNKDPSSGTLLIIEKLTTV